MTDIDRRQRLFEKIKGKCDIVSHYPDDVLGTCWLWQGQHSGKGRGGGYGRIRFEGGWLATHIAMFVIKFGPIPSKKQLDHLCNNRACCNPNHLECVTHKQNQKRRAKRRKAAEVK